MDTFLGEAPDWFRLDRAEGQEHALYVAAEKDTLRQLLTDWLAPFGIPVLVVRGFGSQSYVDVVRDRTAADPRQAHLAYVGDFDASWMRAADLLSGTPRWRSSPCAVTAGTFRSRTRTS